MWFSIGGPTAVGKSSFGLQVAESLIADGSVVGVDIISADSRQVYLGLSIVSGVDIPTGFAAETWQNQTTYRNQDGSIRLWGLAILKPTEEWSVAHFQKYALPIIETAEQTNRLVLIVGGTGLYHQQILQVDPVLHIGPNQEVREQAESMNVEELQAWLQTVDTQKWSTLNHSDQANPRRLVRAIEVCIAQKQNNELTHHQEIVQEQSTISQPLGTICLTAAIELIEARIEERVDQRLQAGAQSEVEQLLAEYPNQKLPVFSATGVKVLAALSAGEIDLATARAQWIRQERQYAKRQLTWYKKQSNVTWYEITKPGWQAQALATITAWLHS